MRHDLIRELKIRLIDLIIDELGFIQTSEGEKFPGIVDGLEFDSSLEYQGIICNIKLIENGNKITSISSARSRGDIEAHFNIFHPATEKQLKDIWDKIDSNFKKVTHFYLEPNEQYGQTGKLVVYFGFDYHYHL